MLLFRQNERNGEKGKKMITGAPFLSTPRLNSVGLGKRTKQRVRTSFPVRERESQKSSASSLEKTSVYLEILGFRPK